MKEESKTVRCAIYTRKSVEMGLEQEFNSLDAQFEACRAYIESKRSLGWTLLPERYDDGGFSGANIRRPAFQRLLQDVRERKVDMIVVYKIDRISRSLLDFSEVLKALETNDAKFVSVTQEFTNATSSGRMMMNLLMTFAQFEREIVAERVRDKAIETRRKGLWPGGTVPYGYVVRDKHLYPDPETKDSVRRIFELYVSLGTAKEVICRLNAEGIMRFPKKGVKWQTHTLYVCLRNPVYVGRIPYRDESYPGQHEPLVDKELWDKVQALVAERSRKGGQTQQRRMSDALLSGIIRCGTCGSMMSYSWTRKTTTGAKYGYYYDNRDSKRGESTCPVKRVPEGPIETVIENKIVDILRTPTLSGLIAERIGCASFEVRDALDDPEAFWTRIDPAAKRHLVKSLIDRVLVHPQSLEIRIRTAGNLQIIKEVKDGLANG